MNEKASKKSSSRKQLTKVQAIIVMAVGGLMLLLSIVIPTAPDSNAHTLKVVVGVLGVLVGIVGASFRPMEPPKDTQK